MSDPKTVTEDEKQDNDQGEQEPSGAPSPADGSTGTTCPPDKPPH